VQRQKRRAGRRLRTLAILAAFLWCRWVAAAASRRFIMLTCLQHPLKRTTQRNKIASFFLTDYLGNRNSKHEANHRTSEENFQYLFQ
jgi:hypothetical protein